MKKQFMQFAPYSIMKSLLVLTALALASVASAADTTKPQFSSTGIAPAPEMNLYTAAAPEPSHAMLLMMGLVGLAVRRRR